MKAERNREIFGEMEGLKEMKMNREIEESKVIGEICQDEGSCLMKGENFDSEREDNEFFDRESGEESEDEGDLDGEFDLEFDLGNLTVELEDDPDDLDEDFELDPDWEDEDEVDWDDEDDDEPELEPEPQQPQSQSLKDFAEDWENRWAEWKWMDDH